MMVFDLGCPILTNIWCINKPNQYKMFEGNVWSLHELKVISSSKTRYARRRQGQEAVKSVDMRAGALYTLANETTAGNAAPANKQCYKNLPPPKLKFCIDA